jgi:hypothetical protein
VKAETQFMSMCMPRVPAGRAAEHASVRARPSLGAATRRLVVALLIALVAAPDALAQVMPTRVVRRSAGLELSDGEPISYFLEHARELELTDPQKLSLMDIRRRLRRVNSPLMAQVDSIRRLLGISLEPRPLLADDLKALERLEVEGRPFTDSIRVNNDAAKAEARSVLDPRQLVRLDSLATAEQALIRGRRPPPPPPF